MEMMVGTAIPKNPLDDLMNQYEMLKNRIKKLKDEKENIKAKLLIEVKTQDLDTYDSEDGLRLVYKRQSRTTWDKVKISHFAEKHNIEEEELKSTNEFESLRITKGLPCKCEEEEND
jgi:hypothetical protein